MADTYTRVASRLGSVALRSIRMTKGSCFQLRLGLKNLRHLDAVSNYDRSRNFFVFVTDGYENG